MPRKIKPGSETTRLNLKVPTTVRERLERLKVTTEADTYGEVVRRALHVYETCVDVGLNGDEILIKSRKDGSVARLIIA